MNRLNVGSGGRPEAGWVNLDIVQGPTVDVVADVQAPHGLPFADDTFDEMVMSHVLEHLDQPLFVMQELHRVAKPSCRFTVKVPYGSSDDAWEDPTHVRLYFLKSFSYFEQPVYHTNDYGYRGDWKSLRIILMLYKSRFEGVPQSEILNIVNRERNAVKEMVVEMECVKPIRGRLVPLITTDTRLDYALV